MSRDGRKLDHTALEAIRIHAVLRGREDGASPDALIDVLGFHRSCIYAWLKRYDEGGLEALKAKPIPGAPVKLAGWQGNWLRQLIVEKTPLDVGYTGAYGLAPSCRRGCSANWACGPVTRRSAGGCGRGG